MSSEMQEGHILGFMSDFTDDAQLHNNIPIMFLKSPTLFEKASSSEIDNA